MISTSFWARQNPKSFIATGHAGIINPVDTFRRGLESNLTEFINASAWRGDRTSPSYFIAERLRKNGHRWHIYLHGHRYYLVTA